MEYQKTDLNTEAYEPFMLEDKQAASGIGNQTNSNDVTFQVYEV